MEDGILARLKAWHLTPGGGPLIVAVSGGLDSMCVLHLLHGFGYDLICAHFDHSIRPGSAQEAAFVEREASAQGVPFSAGKGDVPGHRAEDGLSLEEAARNLRYRFLFDTARREGAQAVVTGHTADDQAETVLMHFLRGSGIDGLSGMAGSRVLTVFDPSIPIVRPFLDTWRADLEAYAARAGLRWIRDESNTDLSIFRNRLRHALLPHLESYNPNIREILVRTARAVAGDAELLAEAARAAWVAADGAIVSGGAGFARRAFLEQPHGLQARMLRQAIQILHPALRDVDFKCVARGLAAAAAGRRCDLLGGLQLLVEDERIWITADEGSLPLDAWPQLVSGQAFEVRGDGTYALRSPWRLEVSSRPSDGFSAGMVVSRNEAFADPEKLTFPLQVRGRLPGDVLRPLGMGGRGTSVADAMINVKIPRRARAGWPVVWSGEEILWIPWVGFGGAFAVSSGSGKVLRLRLRRD